MDKVELMRVFAAVARNGSFTKAADELSIPLQMASKYVKKLEQSIGAQLFDRTTRSVTLNDTGRAYLEGCEELLQQFDALENAIQQKQQMISGKIRMTAPTTYGERVLVPLLAEFQKQNTDVSIDLNLTDRKLSLVDEGFDLGIRIGQLTDSALIAKKLASMRVCICATPEYLKTHGTPKTPEDLQNHNCIIDTNFKLERSWPFRMGNKQIRVHVNGSFFANTPHATYRMAKASVGIVKCPMYVINEDVVNGDLVVLFEENEAYDFGVYALYPHRQHLSARIRALVDFLSARLRLAA